MNSKETAEKIVAHLESRDKPNRGLNATLGRMKRKDFNNLIGEIANLIDGKPAVAAPADTGNGATAGAGGNKATGGSKATGSKAAQA
jgi:hypothetical protein